MSSLDLCKICNKEQFKYSCPKCNIVYCSLGCYKSPEHQKCSEEFYKKCVEDELLAAAAEDRSSEDIKKMYDILQRMNENLEEDELDLDDPPQDELDSDDDNDEDNESSIANRLEGIDINDSEEIWTHLTDSERKDFQALIENGEIMNLLPKHQPWWTAHSSKLVVAVSEGNMPKICDHIPAFSTICSKEPPPCVHNNLWNVVASYACTVKYFNGEHQTNPWEATNYLVGLSANLKNNTNFDDAEQAMVSVEMESITESLALPCEEFAEIQRDCRQIMLEVDFKLAALSDALSLLKLAKEQQFGKHSQRKPSEFTQKFGGKLMDGLSKTKLSLVIKKMEFFLSFVQRDCQ